MLHVLGCALLCLGMPAAADYPMPANVAELRAMAPNLKEAVASLARACLTECDRPRDTRSRTALSDASLLLCMADRLLGGSAQPPVALRARADALVRDGRTVYRGWLGALRTLSVADRRAPDFMQSRARAYEKTNTCLSGWTHLRHASILYAAHSYATPGMSFDPPAGWVEPYPAFYRAMADLAERTARIMRRIGGLDADRDKLLAGYAARCREFAVYAEAEPQGKLTREQGAAIRSFGAWLTGFPFRSEPVIADVATGSDGEVLHAAIGDMNPIVVMPDRDSAIGHVGWVSSYYEIVRPTTERLTDAAWQAMLDRQGMTPDRPAWSAHFLHQDRGPRWEARAPLRQADKLFHAGKADDAVALLRSAIERDPYAEVATECRYRIREHYRQRRMFDEPSHKRRCTSASNPRRENGQRRSGNWSCADAAMEDDRLDEAERLYRGIERHVTELAREFPTIRNVVSGRLGRLDAVRELRQMLEPVLRAEGREDLLQASALLDALNWGHRTLPKIVPQRAAEIRLACMRRHGHGLGAADFLRHHPDHDAAEEAWRIVSKDATVADPRDVVGSLVWLADLVNRKPPYRFRAEAEATFERPMGMDSIAGERNVCRAIRDRWPRTRASAIAGVVGARRLIMENKPEQALSVLAAVMLEPAMDDVLTARADALRRCAVQTIEAMGGRPVDADRNAQGWAAGVRPPAHG